MTKAAFFLMFTLAVLGIAGCENHQTSEYSWNQKLILEVETASGKAAASFVSRIQVSHNDSDLFLPAMRGLRTKVHGEATALVLADGRVVYALLDGYQDDLTVSEIAPQVIAKELVWADDAGSIADRMSLIQSYRGRFTLPEELYPTLVSFTDPNDPTSIFKLNRHNKENVLGKGYGEISVIVEITDEAVSSNHIAEHQPIIFEQFALDKYWTELTPQQRDWLARSNWKQTID